MPASEPVRPSRRPGSSDQPETFSISQAKESLDDEMHHRMKRYLISMSVRTVCFILAVVFDGWLRWSMAAAAIVLPYIAVVMANAGPRTTEHTGSPYSPTRAAVEGGPHRAIDPRTPDTDPHE